MPPCHLPFFLRGNCQFMLTHILLVLRDAAGGLKVTCALGQRTYPLPRSVVIMPSNHGDNRACPQTTVTTQVPAVDIFVSPVTKTLPKIPWGGGHNRPCGREGEGGGGRSGGGGDGEVQGLRQSSYDQLTGSQPVSFSFLSTPARKGRVKGWGNQGKGERIAVGYVLVTSVPATPVARTVSPTPHIPRPRTLSTPPPSPLKFSLHPDVYATWHLL